MIGQQITKPETGEPLDNNGNKLSLSTYQPPDEVKKLFTRVQQDYQVAYALQHRSFQEFDGYSLLDRTRLDQETFGAYVGCQYVPQQKRWMWKGRKNTSRDKLIGIAAHMIEGMLYPMVYAKNENNEEDKMSARVMRILIEDHLRKAKYESKFLQMIISALVNPAVLVQIEYVEAMQMIKQRLKDGSIKITEAVDELLSGLQLNLIPIDELMLADFYTGPIQTQPYIIRVRRISYDLARSIYRGKYFDTDGKDLFDFVIAGTTRMVLTGQENQTLYDIEWTEADRDFVQELTIYYRQEDLQVTWVGGVGMLNEKDVYNSNPFEHRRMTLLNGEWMTIPVYPFAKSGYEPLDPAGRFAYYKSAAFKLFWDDNALNLMSRLAVNATQLDVFKPMFLSGVTKVDSFVMAPGATAGMPNGATATPYQLGPNLRAVYDSIRTQQADISESTQDKVRSGITEPGITATQSAIANKQASISLGFFGLMIADLLTQVGELVMDCTIQYATVGEVETDAYGTLGMKFKTFLAKGKEKGKNITNKVVFTDQYMGRTLSPEKITKDEWALYNSTGKTPEDRANSDQRVYLVNPYAFARYTYSLYVDVDQIVTKSMGNDRQNKILAFNMMTDPRVAPYTDQKAVVEDFVIEEFGGDDPDKYKSKNTGQPNDMLNSIMGQGIKPGQPVTSPYAPAGGGGMVETPKVGGNMLQ